MTGHERSVGGSIGPGLLSSFGNCGKDCSIPCEDDDVPDVFKCFNVDSICG
jgi:hypothetical protein